MDEEYLKKALGRGRDRAVLQSRASGVLLLANGAVMAAGLAIPFTRLGASLDMQPLPASYFPWLVLIMFCYGLLAQLVKRWYDVRFGDYE